MPHGHRAVELLADSEVAVREARWYASGTWTARSAIAPTAGRARAFSRY